LNVLAGIVFLLRLYLSETTKTKECMKLTRLFWVLIVGCLAFSCDDDDEPPSISPSEVSETMVSGNWRVSYYQDRDDDETGDFSLYTFTFTMGGVAVATKNATDVVGAWATTDSSNKVKVVLSFPGSPLDELSKDWEVVQRSSTEIELRHVSGGDGHIDYLTFAKN
jgi:hypothetical protein